MAAPFVFGAAATPVGSSDNGVMTSDGPVSVSDLWVRLDPELWLFAPPRRRRGQVRLRHDGAATLGHVVQALGVPLTEVGGLLVDGVPADPSQLSRPETVVEVRPVERPQQDPGRFVLDVHLGKLARRLRLLGVDVAYRNDAADDELVEQTRRQRRLLLTRDRGLLCRRALWAGAHVRGERAFEQLADVLDRFAPSLAPWTRCLSCGGELYPVSKQDVVDELEPGTRRCYDDYVRCGLCGRVYWRGAHAGRLDAIVAAARSVHPSVRGPDQGRGG